MDMEKLAAEAALAAIKELSKTAVEGGVAVGGKLWTWIRAKASGAEAAVVEAVAAAPEKASASNKVSGLLKDLLDGRPDLQAELEALLAEARKAGGVSQALNQSGTGHTAVQIAGDRNKVKLGS